MSSLGSGPSTALDSTYGSLLIGVLFATFFQGILTVQAFNYYDSYPNDPPKLKLLVAFVCALDTAHLGLICQSIYHYLVTNWGFTPALAQLTDTLNLHLIFTALSCFICQLFFLERIWVFSRKNTWVVAFLFCVCLVPCVLDIVITIFSIAHVKVNVSFIPPIIGVIFVSGALGDVLIASFLCHYLHKEGGDFERTRSVISRVVQFIVATGLATSVLAVAAVIAFYVRHDGMYFIAIHFSLGRTYTNALLATLNARQHMRAMLTASRRPRKAPTPKDAVFKTIALSGPSHSNEMEIAYTIERITDRDIELNKVQDFHHSRKDSKL
ncbi:hypothetical protein BJ165DRAFT_1448331 [Panaeolus papilionaceus]|nr:hypothetical protein BJ165DRAFT_1448331 [Panaeolus papilionaceus]